MKLNELPKSFWTDTRRDAIERQKIEYITREFRNILRKKDVSYSLYALTITANEGCVKKLGIWFDDDARNGFCGDIYNSFNHRLSSEIQSNYKRNTHADKRFFSWGVIEHLSRDKKTTDKNGKCVTERVTPHIHATIAVHPDWEQKFLSCFQRNLCRDHFSLSLDFRNRCMGDLNTSISSVRLEPIYDLYGWSGYCMKQVPDLSQRNQDPVSNTGVFNHDGLTKKDITEEQEDLPMRLTKNAVITDINQSHSVDAVRISKDELPADKNKRVNDLKREIDRRLRQNKDLTIVIVE